MVVSPTHPISQPFSDNQCVFHTVRKRNGARTAFDATKITDAIAKAGAATGEFTSDSAALLSLRVMALLQTVYRDGELDVESIQDIVEEVLLSSPYKKTAKAYIIYRDQHARIRELAQKADLDLIDGYLEKLDWQVSENSNMAYSLQGLNNYLSSEVSKVYWLNKIYPPEIRDAHASGDFHIHDLGILSVYCVGWDLQDLLVSGFQGAPGKVESKPARHLRTALGQIVNFFYTLQGEAAGAQAFSHFDTYLAPFIRYDGLDYQGVKQALQEFIFNINVPTRVGFQTPFTNITLDLTIPKHLRQEPVVWGGERKQDVYGDFQHEANLFNRAFLEVMAEGDAKDRVFSFPIPTYNITPDFDWDSEEIDALWTIAAKYGIPYFANFINTDMSVDESRSMCCRLRLDTSVLEKRGGGLFGANPLTGSIGVVTVNMPRLGYLSVDEDDFMNRLDALLYSAKDSLEIKRKVLERLTDKGLYPYTKYYLRDIHQRNGNYWTNHFSTIGLVGMNEACMHLLGKDIGTAEGVRFATGVLDRMRMRLSEFQEETGNLYNLEATPAESASFRLARLDAERHSAMRVDGNSGGVPLYTNSTQLPVNYSNDVFEVLQLQDELQKRYTGGTVQHVFLGEAVADPKAVKTFVKKVCESFHIPYFTLSPTFSICPAHGYVNGEQAVCPDCGAKTEIFSRVVGYLRPVDQWNEGKREEFAQRSTFMLADGS